MSEHDDTLRRRIEERAYFRYCERGCAPGAELDDWLAAEQEILAELKGDTAGQEPSGPEGAGGRRSGPRRRRR